MLAANKDEHREMDEKFQDVMEVLNVEIGRTSVIRRTRQHLFGSELALRTPSRTTSKTNALSCYPSSSSA